jgi:hypothetical protein
MSLPLTRDQQLLVLVFRERPSILLAKQGNWLAGTRPPCATAPRDIPRHHVHTGRSECLFESGRARIERATNR